MNKFLLGSYKVGKVFSIFAISLTSLAIIISIILMLFSIGHYKINYYTPQELQEFEKSKVEVKKIVKIKDVEKNYGIEIKEILFHSNYDESHYDNIISLLSDMKKEYRNGYVKNLKSFIIEGKAFAEQNLRKEVKHADERIVEKVLKQYKKEIEATALLSYSKMYIEQVENIEMEKAAKKIYRFWLMGILLSSIFIFIAFLTVPLLIKIEENTRK